MEAEPRSSELRITQARIQGLQGHWGNAVTLMQEALQDNPRRPDLHEELGRVLRKAGRNIFIKTAQTRLLLRTRQRLKKAPPPL